MSDPSDFVSFADYLGLNDEAGQQMLNQQMGEGDRLREAALKAGDTHEGLATAAGQGNDGGAYASTGKAAAQGLASYGEFMAGMNDPAKRQALMEKTYGKGAASWLDSALVGGSGAGRIAQGQQQFRDTQGRMNQQMIQADGRRGESERTTAAKRASEEAELKRRQDAADKAAADKAKGGPQAWEADFNATDKGDGRLGAKTIFEYLDPLNYINGGKRGVGMQWLGDTFKEDYKGNVSWMDNAQDRDVYSQMDNSQWNEVAGLTGVAQRNWINQRGAELKNKTGRARGTYQSHRSNSWGTK